MRKPARVRWRRLAVLLALLAGSVGGRVLAQDFVTYESVTVADSAIGITSTVRSPAGRPPQTACEARLETAQVRFRFDGTAPTSSEGSLLEVGEVLTLRGAATLAAFRAIRTGGTSGVLKIHCYVDRL